MESEPRATGSFRQAGRKEELGQAAEDASETASEGVREGFEQARHSGRGASQAAMRGYEEGREFASRNIERQPLLTLAMAAMFGYLLAWLLHGRR